MLSNLILAFMYEFCNDTKINEEKGGWLVRGYKKQRYFAVTVIGAKT
jgi:hypothetical protein